MRKALVTLALVAQLAASAAAGQVTTYQTAVLTSVSSKAVNGTWTPLNLATAARFYYDPGDVGNRSVSGSNLTGLTNKGSITAALVPVGVPTITAANLNGKDVMTVSGSSQGMSNAGAVFAACADATIFAVVKTTVGNGNYRGIFGVGSTTSAGYLLGYWGGTNNGFTDGDVFVYGKGWSVSPRAGGTSSATTDTTGYHILRADVGATATDIFVDGSETVTYHVQTTGTNDNGTFPVTFGYGDPASSIYWHGNIAVGGLTCGATLQEKQKLEGWMASPTLGWNLRANLPNGHPWKTVAP